MADNKKYYYMRLKENFFDTDDLKMLEAMPDGYLYSNILIKLYLKSLKYEGRLLFKDTIPYNSQMIATITGHHIGVVEKALQTFHDLGLITILDGNVMYMNEIEMLVGKTSTEADRKREVRKKIDSGEFKALPISESGQMSGQMSDEIPTNIHQSIELELELEIDIEKDNKKTSCQKFSTFDLAASEKLYELMKLNNDSVKKPNLESWAKEVRLMRERDSRTEEQIMYVIEWCQKDVFWKTNILSTKKLREKFDALVVKIKTDKERRLNNNGWNERTTNDFGFSKKLEDRVGF